MLNCPCFAAAAQLQRYSTPSRASPKPKQQLQSPTALRGNGGLVNEPQAVRLISHAVVCTIFYSVVTSHELRFHLSVLMRVLEFHVRKERWKRFYTCFRWCLTCISISKCVQWQFSTYLQDELWRSDGELTWRLFVLTAFFQCPHNTQSHSHMAGSNNNIRFMWTDEDRRGDPNIPWSHYENILVTLTLSCTLPRQPLALFSFGNLCWNGSEDIKGPVFKCIHNGFQSVYVSVICLWGESKTTCWWTTATCLQPNWKDQTGEWLWWGLCQGVKTWKTRSLGRIRVTWPSLTSWLLPFICTFLTWFLLFGGQPSSEIFYLFYVLMEYVYHQVNQSYLYHTIYTFSFF